jgi:tRNA-specific 2-thiouridylase
MFPLGEMSKPEVREVAREHALAVAEKSESQEICFVPDGNYAGFIDRYLDATGSADRKLGMGEIVGTGGEVMGHHAGIHHYTIGQRRGIGIAAERPLYVIEIDAANNQVVVGDRDELLGREFIAAGVNWVARDSTSAPVRAEVSLRYRHTPGLATITPVDNSRVRVRFDEPQRAITPGQATVFYSGDEVLGGGWIVKSSAVKGKG